VKTVTNLVRVLGVLLFLGLSFAAADASVTVNKSFSSGTGSISVGDVDTVTILLRNTDTTTDAVVTSLRDNIGTMANTAVVNAAGPTTGTCAGADGNPAPPPAATFAGNVYSLGGFSIPEAFNAGTPGTCTLTFQIIGNQAGTGMNTIASTDVVMANPALTPDPITQTLVVTNVNASITNNGNQTVLAPETAPAIVYTITNPATSLALSNAAFSISVNSAGTYSIASANVTNTCGATATNAFPVSGATQTLTFTGGTIPAHGSCTVSIGVTGPTAGTTVNTQFAGGALTDAQGVSNTVASSASVTFSSGQPVLGKSFNPSTIQPAGNPAPAVTTSTLSISIRNPLLSQSLTTAGITDTMPAGITLVSATPAQCGGTVSTTATVLTFANGTIGPGATCTLTATVQATAGATNTVPANNFTSDQTGLTTAAPSLGAANPASATLTLTGGSGDFGMSKTALLESPNQPQGSYGNNFPFQFQVQVGSIAGSQYTGGTFSDNLAVIAPHTVILDDGGAHVPASSGCATPVFTDTNGGSTISATGVALTAGGTCTITFWAEFSNVIGAPSSGTNTATVTFPGPVTHSANATVTQLPALYVQNYTTSNFGLVNQPITVAGQIRDDNGISDSGGTAVFVLNGAAFPHSVVLSPTPNFTFTNCPAGLTAANITIPTPAESFSVAIPGAITQTCTIGYNVINENVYPAAGAAGTFVSGNSTYSSPLTSNVATPSTGVGFAEFATSNITPTKSFTPANIVAGQPSQVAIALSLAGEFPGTTPTIANNVFFTDSLPTNMIFTAAPNPTFGGCGASPAAVVNAGTTPQTIAFSGITLTATGSTSNVCTINFNVTSSINGAPPPNMINANSIMTTTGGITNSTGVAASLTVIGGVAVTKSFVAPNVSIGSPAFARFLLSNSSVSAPLTASILDPLPGNLALTSLTLGPGLLGDNLCIGGAVSGTLNAAGAPVTVSNITVPPYNTGTKVPGSCVVYIQLGAPVTVVPGTVVTNSVPAGDVVIGGGSANATAASTTFTAAPNVALSKAFAPATILPGATSVLTVSIINTATGSAQLTGLALTDNLPANVTIAATPNASTTCTGGTVTAVANASSVGLAGGSVAPNTTCTITVSVTGTVSGIYTNTVGATGNLLTSTQGATNSAPASAVLNIGNVSGVTLAKSFTPALIAAGGTSVLQITINNTMTGAVALSALALNDTLPANVVIAPAPTASTTCGTGVVSAVAGGTVVGLAGGTLAAGASCSIFVTVTSATSGIYINTILPNALSDAQSSTNLVQAQATLNVGNASGVGISKTFAPISIAANGVSTLTISVVNNAASAVALSGMGLSDTLPGSVRVAPLPNAATTCTGGTVSAAAGATVVALSGGTVAANATCTITLSVTSPTAGVFTNTIPANTLTDAQASTNNLPASAILNVANASGVGLSKAFLPTVIAPGATSVLTITLTNTQANAVPLTALTFVDNLPTNVTIAATPNASTTCAGGTVGAVAASGVVTLSGVTMAVNNTCTVTVTVTGTVPNSYTNTIPPNAISTTQGASNATPALATLVIGQPALVLTKTSVPSAASVSPGETIAYSIVIKNGGMQAETTAHISDTLNNATLVPGSVTVNGQPEPDAVVTAGQTFGSIAVGATATIAYSATVNLTAPTGTIVSNTATVLGDQPCTIGSCTSASTPNSVSPPVITAAKTIDGQTNESVVAGQTVTYGVTVSNTGTSPAVNTVITDNVPAGVTPINGTFTLNGSPLLNATVSGQVLTIPVTQINAGTSALVTFNAKIGATAGNAANLVSVMAAGLARAVQSNTAMAHQVPATLTVTKTASASTATVGDRVDYQIVVAPVGGVAYGATIVVDTLPPGELYAPGTSRVNGKPGEPTVDGHTLIWTLPALGTQATFTYSTVVAPGVTANSTLTNTVSATAVAPGGAGLGRGTGSATVLVTASTFGSCYPITGRVYLDYAARGHFQDPDIGLAGVYVYLDNGENVSTDKFGRYDFPCVQPGMHALRLDESTLPLGAVPYDDRNIDSEKSTRRLVHHIFDTNIIEDINFAVTGTLKAPQPVMQQPSSGPPPK
jgi:uncharacterized repeat protein (TIGR01451 family)